MLAAAPVALLGIMAASPANAVPESAGAADGADRSPSYVALGDSYASGFGLAPYSSFPVAGCFQSEADYPHRVADALGLALTDVTCAGAETVNVIDTAQQTAPEIFAPPQVTALDANTDVVTLTIGGNDLGFSTVLPQCLAATAAGPLLGDPSITDCVSEMVKGGTDVLGSRLQYLVLPRFEQTLRAIAEQAPNAEVVVVGYPTIFPSAEDAPEGGCFVSALGNGQPPFPENAFPFTDADTAYFHELQLSLDAGLARVASEQGATFVSTLDESSDRSPCAGNTDAWVSGLTLEATPENPQPEVKLGGLHPNEAGVAFLADRVETAVAASLVE
jgi:lysophospholipase L1-like esterase